MIMTPTRLDALFDPYVETAARKVSAVVVAAPRRPGQRLQRRHIKPAKITDPGLPVRFSFRDALLERRRSVIEPDVFPILRVACRIDRLDSARVAFAADQQGLDQSVTLQSDRRFDYSGVIAFTEDDAAALGLGAQALKLAVEKLLC